MASLHLGVFALIFALGPYSNSWIFTTNDVLVNIGVDGCRALVLATGSKVPDLLVGAVVFCLVAYGALRILKL